jgi:hypothetical protein
MVLVDRSLVSSLVNNRKEDCLFLSVFVVGVAAIKEQLICSSIYLSCSLPRWLVGWLGWLLPGYGQAIG